MNKVILMDSLMNLIQKVKEVLRKKLVMIFKNTQLVKKFPMGQILGKSLI